MEGELLWSQYSGNGRIEWRARGSACRHRGQTFPFLKNSECRWKTSAGQLTDNFGERGVIVRENFLLARLVISEVKPGSDRRSKQRKASACLQARSLPDPSSNDNLR